MEQSKKEFLPVLQGVKLSKTQNPTMAENGKEWIVIPYASVIGSIKYAMLYQTYCVPCYEFGKGIQFWSKSWSLDSGQEYP